MSDVTDHPRPSRLRPLAMRTAFAATALIAWAFAARSAAPASRVGLFILAAGAVFGAVGRRVWPALTLVGALAFLMHEPGARTLDRWSLLFLAATGTGLAMWLHRWPGLRWMAASIPCWVYANESDWVMAAALALTIGGFAVLGIGPTLLARRRRRAAPPLARLTAGPLASIQPRTFPAARRSRPLTVATVAFAMLSVGLSLAAASGRAPVETGALGLSAAIIAVTFAFSSWFSGRVRLRVDDVGIHGRMLFRELTVPWSQVSTLALRYVFLPAYSMRLVYYCVQSSTTEVSFPGSMPGAADLRATVERATGETWPEPEIEANF